MKQSLFKLVSKCVRIKEKSSSQKFQKKNYLSIYFISFYRWLSKSNREIFLLAEVGRENLSISKLVKNGNRSFKVFENFN